MERTYTHYALADPRIDDPVRRIRYIGRTTQSLRLRFKGHRKNVREGGKTHRDLWMRQVQSCGLEVIMIDLGPGPEEREGELIVYWRKLGADLTNRTKGGEGCPGYAYTPEQRAKISKARKATAANPEWREKVSKATAAALNTPEMKAKVAAGVRRHYEKPGSLERRQALQREILARPEVRAKIYTPENKAKIAAQTRERMARPEVKEKLRAAVIAYRAQPDVKKADAERAKRVMGQPEVIAKARDTRRATWRARHEADPTYRQVLLLSSRGVSMKAIARQTGLSYKQVVHRREKLKRDGLL